MKDAGRTSLFRILVNTIVATFQKCFNKASLIKNFNVNHIQKYDLK